MVRAGEAEDILARYRDGFKEKIPKINPSYSKKHIQCTSFTTIHKFFQHLTK